MARCKRPWHSIKWRATSCGGSLQTQLRGSPVSSLGVVPDLTISFHSNSLGNGKTLLLFFGLESLDSESLMRRHSEEQTQAHTGWWGRGESPSVCQEGWKPTNPELLLQLHGVLYHIQNSPQRPRPSRAPLTMRTTVLWPLTGLPLAFPETRPRKTPKVKHSFGSALTFFSHLVHSRGLNSYLYGDDSTASQSHSASISNWTYPKHLPYLRRLSKELQFSSFIPFFSFFPDSYTSHHSSASSSAHLLKGLVC